MKLTVPIILVAAALTTASPVESLEKRAVTCLKVGATATATWKNAAGKTCKWTGVVGSNFGTNSVTGGEYVLTTYTTLISCKIPRLIDCSYSCNGRCGAGCTGTAIGNAYTQDCFSHDICSWFNNASGGARYGHNSGSDTVIGLTRF
jgi:hypothetical protein